MIIVIIILIDIGGASAAAVAHHTCQPSAYENLAAAAGADLMISRDDSRDRPWV